MSTVWHPALIWLWTLLCTKGFILDQYSDGQQCPGMTMLCPQMCLKYDRTGCLSCDCNNGFDPANPGKHFGSPNSAPNPANPLQGGRVPGSSICTDDWINCACAPSLDASSGCVLCQCSKQTTGKTTDSSSTTASPPEPTSRVTHSLPTTAGTSMSTSSKPATKNITTTQYLTTGPKPPMTSSTLSTTPATTRLQTTEPTRTTTHSSTTQSSTAQSSTIRSTTQSMTTRSSTSLSRTRLQTTQPPTTSTTSRPSTSFVFNTKLPEVQTTPLPSVASTTTRETTTTPQPFVCPGIFNCSLDCYAGFMMDDTGCPKCQCAPIPTDLP